MSLIGKARTSLGFVEDKLRRSLGLAGDIGTAFTPTLIPVSIADDSTRPGCNSLKGRRFAAGFSVGAVAAGQMAGFKVTQASIIHTLTLGATAAANGTINVLLQTPELADPAAAVFSSILVPWSERRASNTDWAPVQIANNFAIGATVSTTQFVQIVGTAFDDHEIIRKPMHLEAGSRIWFHAASALQQFWYRFDGEVF